MGRQEPEKGGMAEHVAQRDFWNFRQAVANKRKRDQRFLEEPDERVAQIYNNLAVTAASLGQKEKAEEYFRRAIQILRKSAFPECESAVTYCNMAIVYGRSDPEDPRIGDCLELAWNQLSVPDIPKDHCYAQALDQCLPVFDHFGYFLYTMNLKDRLRDVDWA